MEMVPTAQADRALRLCRSPADAADGCDMTESMLQDVVVGVDGSPGGSRAVAWAAEYARTVGARLTLVTAWHWPSYGAPYAVEDWTPSDDADRILEKAVAELSLPSRRVKTRSVQGPAGQALVDAAEHADLLVVGTRGHGGLASAVLGSVSTHCVHHARCPVVVVR